MKREGIAKGYIACALSRIESVKMASQQQEPPPRHLLGLNGKLDPRPGTWQDQNEFPPEPYPTAYPRAVLTNSDPQNHLLSV
jgi:hypothetical protein